MGEKIYHFGEGFDGRHGLKFEIAGISFCDGSYRIVRPASSVSCIEYIVKGSGTVRIDSQEFHPREGDTYFLHQGKDHHYFSDKDTPWVKLWVNVGGDLLTDLVRRYGLEGRYHIPGFYSRNYLQQIIRHARMNDSNAALHCTLTVHELLFKLGEHLHHPGKQSDAARMKSYLDNRVAESVTLSELAQAVGKSESQAIRLFKQRFALTPHQYHLRLKLEFAKKLLRSTSMTIKEIAAYLSFADEFYFSNLFKKRAGVAPSYFRHSDLWNRSD